jgi:uncharacterized repeat protein (TIGR01451 family)
VVQNRVDVTYELSPGVARTVSDSVSFTVGAGGGVITPSLSKQVDRALGAPGDLLTYTLRARLEGDGPPDSVFVDDPLPDSVRYEPGTLELDGVGLSDEDDGDGGSFDPATRTVRVDLTALPLDSDALITFRARIEETAPIGHIVGNEAEIRAYTATGTFAAAAGPTNTLVAAPALELSKSVSGPDPATVGDTLVYTIQLTNPSTQLAAVDVGVVDTLPALLVLEGAIPAPSVSGQELRWNVARLEPGESRTFQVAAGVGVLPDTVAVVNRAWLQRDGASGEFAESAPSVLVPPNNPPGGEPPDPRVSKTVDRTSAAPGDVLTYAIGVRLEGTVSADSLFLEDFIPDFTTYEAGTLRLNGAPLTDDADGDVGSFDPVTGSIRVTLTGLPPGQDATVGFSTRVDDGAPVGTIVSNFALLSAYAGDEPAEAFSPAADTEVSAPSLEIAKSFTGPDPASEGDTLTWTIEVTNPSPTLAATSVTVVDTVPAPVVLLDTSPSAVVSGAEARWTISRLEPGQTRTFVIRGSVPAVEDTVQVVNRAHLLRDGATGEFAESPVIRLIPPPQASMALGLEAELLEIAVGESLPLVATVTNDGALALTEAVVKLLIPRGSRFSGSDQLTGVFVSDRLSPESLRRTAGGPQRAPARAPGDFDPRPLPLDSFAVMGDTLLVWLPGELLADETIAVRWALTVTSAQDGAVMSRALASARLADVSGVGAAVVAANEAQAMVALARNRALETRTVIGNVFHDADGDGRQSAGEPGIGGVDVVTEDGEVVTTDSYGKFSVNNLRPGRHVFRVDPLTVPPELVLRRRGIGRRMQVVEVDGFTTASVSFALDAVEAAPAATPDALEAAAPASLDDWAAEADAPEPPRASEVRVNPLRSEADRDDDAAAAFLHGPPIRIQSPVDGTVEATNRLYIGVEAEPMAPVALFRGDTLLKEATLLPNGVGDFVGVPLEPGPQIFRVRTTNSWGAEHWDSVRVHRSGRPVRITPEDRRVTVQADGRTPARVRARLYDEWGVPVVNQPVVTVRMDEGAFLGPDADASSVGHQVQADPDGWVTVELVGARTPGDRILDIEGTDATASVTLRTVAAVRPLLLTGVGQVSIGSAGDDFGALTARGRLTDETALTLSVDTRRLDQGRDVFGRNFDPLEEGQQPILGDASVQRSLSPSRSRVFGRLERGLDWVTFGDVETHDFSEGMTLARYGRSVSGAAARVTTGPVVWNAFGAATTQALQQIQIRGNGTSGPFELGAGILPGTELVRIEVRALENTTRLVSETLLTRYAEYQIDYERGTLLLKQPVPAADPFGNPIFLTVAWEGESGGDRSAVFGVRASGEMHNVAGGALDAVPVSASFVNDDQPGRGFRLGAVQAGLVQESGLEMRAEVAVAEGVDSSGVATRLRVSSPLLAGRASVMGEWLRIGDEFTNPGNVAMRGGTEELRATAGVRVGAGEVSASYEQQDFASRGLERSRTTVGYEQKITETVGVEARLAGDASASAGDERSSGAGEYKVTWSATERLDLFAEGRNELWSSGDGLANRGAYYGVGASLGLARGFGLEARHLRVTPAGDANPYALTNVGLTSELRAGTRAWGAYQIAGGIDGTRNAALVGLNHRFALGSDWRFSTMLERRQGVAGAAIGDPVLASPFEQPEEDYTSVGVGTEYLPEAKPYRVSFRAENRSGREASSRLATLAGDISFDASVGVLSRQEFVERDVAGSLTTRYTRERSSLWGLAYRPTGRNDLNVLFKFAWKDAINPFGSGVLASEGEESRLIGAVEAIWRPLATLELGARFATRTTRLESTPDGALPQAVRSETDFLGVRSRFYVNEWSGLEVETRGLVSGSDAAAVWDVAPSLVLHPFEALEVEVGYRFGELQDPDFAIRSGEGAFLTLGVRFTEEAVSTAADFWRTRIRGER